MDMNNLVHFIQSNADTYTIDLISNRVEHYLSLPMKEFTELIKDKTRMDKLPVVDHIAIFIVANKISQNEPKLPQNKHSDRKGLVDITSNIA